MMFNRNLIAEMIKKIEDRAKFFGIAFIEPVEVLLHDGFDGGMIGAHDIASLEWISWSGFSVAGI